MEERVESSAKGTSKEVLEVMDTPERSKNSQIAASISKFEVRFDFLSIKFAFLLLVVQVIQMGF